MTESCCPRYTRNLAGDLDSFQKIVTSKLEALATATAKRRELESKLDPIADGLDQATAAFNAPPLAMQ
jgi:hypothetical protein